MLPRSSVPEHLGGLIHRNLQRPSVALCEGLDSANRNGLCSFHPGRWHKATPIDPSQLSESRA